jgi:hypothetical protein
VRETVLAFEEQGSDARFLAAAMQDDDDTVELDPTDRDDAAQIVSVALNGIQRERAAADASYLRGRNVLTFSATLFAGVQAALVASAGKETSANVKAVTTSANVKVVTTQEFDRLLWPAAIAAVLLLVAVAVLFFYLDRARPQDVVGGQKLEAIWDDRYGRNLTSPRLLVLMKATIEEEKEWALKNGERRCAAQWLGLVCFAAAAASFVELVLLLFAIR